MRCEDIKIISNIHLHDDLYQMTLPFPYTAMAGQFVMLRKEGSAHLLSRPISICNIQNDVLYLVYQAVGRGTKELAAMKPGDTIAVTGPMGQGFPVHEIEEGKKVALVGGGVGVAPLVMTAHKLSERGIHCDAHVGFRSKSCLVEELAVCCDKVSVSTEDGSEGQKGLVTGTLANEKYDYIFCCGPTPMMKAVVALAEESNTPIYVSLETRMACGIGACRVCTCTTHEGKNLRTCIEGPVFNGSEVDFNA